MDGLVFLVFLLLLFACSLWLFLWASKAVIRRLGRGGNISYFLACFAVYLVTAVVVVNVVLSFLLSSWAYISGCRGMIVVDYLNPVVLGLECGYSNFGLAASGGDYGIGSWSCLIEGGRPAYGFSCPVAQGIEAVLLVFGFFNSLYGLRREGKPIKKEFSSI